jgi:glycerophosphoryl diester phosphodiesterase
MQKAVFDFQGHRGCRGLMPENTIPAFLHALSLGITTLEMDVVITQDLKVVVSHEPFLNHEICSGINGKQITAANEKDYNIFQMSYAQLSKYDCGSKNHVRFPTQENLIAHKPLLSEVFEAAVSYIIKNKLPDCKFNIEIKSTVEGEDIFHPPYQQFTNLLVEVCEQYKVLDRLTIQSFDVRPLQYLRQYFPYISLSLLVENELTLSDNIHLLGFIPTIYSPDYVGVTDEVVKQCKEYKMQIIPWTVNELSDMKKLINMGVDGLISDYPDRFLLL